MRERARFEGELRDLGLEAEKPDPSSLPASVNQALEAQKYAEALRIAIGAGWRDTNALTNLIFFAKHPELPHTPLDPSHKDFTALSREWSGTFTRDVWPAIVASAANTDLAVTGKEAADHHRFFLGARGKKLLALVQKAAADADLNPGLLGTIMMAETRRPLSYLSSDKVSSYHVGTDDFYEGRQAISSRVPAYAAVGWDRKQKPDEHLNDAQTKPRVVKTILFDSGADAALATAVYVKYGEVRLREKAAELGGDFDALPQATSLALTRMAMAAGVTGATKYLKDALAGKDIFVRKPIKVRAYQTKRNATVRTAQAMHLSDWVFGIPIPAATKPAAKKEKEAETDFAYRGFEGAIDAGASASNAPESEGEIEWESGWEGETQQSRFAQVDSAIREAKAKIAAHGNRLKRFAADPGPSDPIARAREETEIRSWSAELAFLESLKSFFESQAGVALTYSMYPVTQVDPISRKFSQNNKWVQATKRSTFSRGEQQGSFCLGAARSMAFRTLFGADRPKYREVLTELKKGIEEAHKQGDTALEARLIISRIVTHTSSTRTGPGEQFNQDIGARYRVKDVMVRPETTWAEALKALKLGAPVMADLEGGWHWIMLRRSPRGQLWASDPLSGGEVRLATRSDFGTRFEVIVSRTTAVPVTPATVDRFKL